MLGCVMESYLDKDGKSIPGGPTYRGVGIVTHMFEFERFSSLWGTASQDEDRHASINKRVMTFQIQFRSSTLGEEAGPAKSGSGSMRIKTYSSSVKLKSNASFKTQLAFNDKVPIDDTCEVGFDAKDVAGSLKKLTGHESDLTDLPEGSAPVMKIFRTRSIGTGCTLISYVDNGDIIVQSLSIDTNCVMLRHAYGIVFNLMTFALEHDKTGLFHFTRARTVFDRPLDLGYAPYTGDNPLKPKTYWRYLGFWFDWNGDEDAGQLHKGSLPSQLTHLVPLWFFEGAKNKGARKALTSMQWKAACWITGAFRTSPTGGTESLAGLPLIHLHLRKLSQRAILRTATFSDTHPLRLLFKGEHAKAAGPMHGAACWASIERQKQKSSPRVLLDELTEEFSPCSAR
ncbi:hypothetical protein MD484_g9086, partial [Candolleomyces efflorescens]